MSNTLYDLFEPRIPGNRSRTFLEVPGGRAWIYADIPHAFRARDV